MNLEDYITFVFGEPWYNDLKEERLHRITSYLNFRQFSKAEVLDELESVKSKFIKFLDREIDYIRNTEFDE